MNTDPRSPPPRPPEADLAFLFQPPTAEQQRAWARGHLQPERPFRVDAWPPALRAMAGPMVELRLSEAERQLIQNLWRLVNGDDLDAETRAGVEQEEKALATRIQAAVDFWDTGAFVRLNTRSPKDNWDWVDNHGKPRPIASAQDALDVLAGSMERVFDDLRAAELAGEGDPVFLVIRPYISFEPWREVRLFIENGQLVGISQYFYHDVFEDMQERTRGWKERLGATVTALLPQLPWASFTLDGWVDDAGQFRFLEVNPPVSVGVTDPALFLDGVFDGSFRLRVAAR